jgi:hypothetical protein
MNADARHGGLRTQRCLPAEFHQLPTTDSPKDQNDRIARADSSSGPQVMADHSHCPKARQLTLFYRLLPHLRRIQAKG